MADLASDRRAVVDLVAKEYLKLSKLDLRHELLKHLTNVTKKGFEYPHNKMSKQEFFKKYAPENIVPVSVMLARYYLDLRNAIYKIKKIDKPRSKTIERIFKNEKIG